jgi:NAD(P)-dependent dehydrogenase (short-subunit alcohol dehydrogenase family)
MTDPDLTGRRLLIVGASSGIGRGVALAAAAAGAEIVVVGRRDQLLEKVLDEAGRGTAICADLRDPEQCARIGGEAAEALGGGVDAVLHSLGTSPLLRIAETPADVWTDTFATNVIAPALVTASVLPYLAADGLVAFVSSRSVGRPYHGVGAYSASKASLDQTILSWRLENPDRRFLRLEIGDTLGTDFARNFDPRQVGELMPLWISHGIMAARQMDSDDLGLLIAKVIAVSLEHPGIAPLELVLHPPGGPKTSGSEEAVRRAQRTQAASGN